MTNPVARIEAIADSSGFDWRAAGVTIHFGYNPDACCHSGIYDYRDNSLWIGMEGGGLLRYKNGTFRSFSSSNGLTNNFVRALSQAARGTPQSQSSKKIM